MILWLLTVRPRGWSEAKLLRVAGADVAHLEDLRPLLDPTAAAVGSVALRSVVADGVRRRWLCSSERWLEDGAQRTLEILAAEQAEQVARECYAADAETRRQCIERRVDAAPCFIIERALLEAAVHATLGARLPDEPQDDELARAVWHQWQVHRLKQMVAHASAHHGASPPHRCIGSYRWSKRWERCLVLGECGMGRGA